MGQSLSRRAQTTWVSLHGHRPAIHARRKRRVVVVPEEPAVATISADQQRRSAEIEKELQMARDIQQGLLLEAVPHLAGWELSAVSLPARDLGGDLYDFLALGDGIQGIMIGDVSGKGLPAALRMAVARTVFRHAARQDHDPAPTLAEVNRSVLSEIPQGMVTMLYARLNLQAGELHLANAGHMFPLIVNGSVHELELSGLPLGVDFDSDYNEARASIGPGDSVLLYTDGVLEAENAKGEIFGYERLAELIANNRTLKPRAIIALLLHALRAWSGGELQSDDVTMVVIRRRLTQLDAELYSIAQDVLGPEQAARLWEILIPLIGEPCAASAEQWIAAMPEVLKLTQATFGRGLARELHQQLRLALEDYRR